MIPHLRQSVTSQGALQTAREAVGMVGYAIRVLEDVIVHMIAGTKPSLVVSLLVFQLQEEGFYVGKPLIGSLA